MRPNFYRSDTRVAARGAGRCTGRAGGGHPEASAGVPRPATGGRASPGPGCAPPHGAGAARGRGRSGRWGPAAAPRQGTGWRPGRWSCRPAPAPCTGGCRRHARSAHEPRVSRLRCARCPAGRGRGRPGSAAPWPPSRLGGVEVVAAPIGIEGTWQAVHGDHLGERPQGAHGAFLVHQKGGVDRAGGVVHRHDQIELLIEPRQPTV